MKPLKHSTIVGVLLGLVTAGIVYALDLPIYLLALAPIVSALFTGSIRTGAKNGWLTFIIPATILTLIALSRVHFPLVSNSNVPNIGTAILLYATVSSLAQIMLVLVLFIVGLMFVVGSVASLILGAVGGAISRLFFKKEAKQ